MKALQTLIENIKELISEAAQSQSGYKNMRLIPLPVKTEQRRLPNNNHNR